VKTPKPKNGATPKPNPTAERVAQLEALIYRNCDPFDATPEDAAEISRIAAAITKAEGRK
jgi:hypothetical protein